MSGGQQFRRRWSFPKKELRSNRGFPIQLCSLNESHELQAYAYPKSGCSVRMHKYCLEKNFPQGKVGRVCPRCSTSWALSEVDGEEESNNPSSQKRARRYNAQPVDIGPSNFTAKRKRTTKEAAPPARGTGNCKTKTVDPFLYQTKAPCRVVTRKARGCDAEHDATGDGPSTSMSPKLHRFKRDVGGCDIQKQEIREAIEFPLTHHDLYKQIGIDPPRGVLLYGSLGTGKTILAKVVANHTTADLIRVVGFEFFQKYLGEGPRMVRDVFRLAKENAPAIIFVNDVDAIAAARFDAQTGADREVQRILMELLNQMDGFDQTVKVIMATNRSDTLDPGLLSLGRLDRKIEFPLPNSPQKRLVFQGALPCEGRNLVAGRNYRLSQREGV